MEGSFVPECYFDTVLLKAMLQIKGAVNHKKGCNNVMKAMKDGRLSGNFAVGIIDRDKTDLDYLGEFEKYEFDKLNLYKHRLKPQFVIQLNPPLERWILEVAAEANISISTYGLPDNVDRLKKLTKSELADETNELKDLCKALIESNSQTIRRMTGWVRYLKEKKYQADINQLISLN